MWTSIYTGTLTFLSKASLCGHIKLKKMLDSDSDLDPDLDLEADSYNIWEIFIIYNIYASSWSVCLFMVEREGGG